MEEAIKANKLRKEFSTGLFGKKSIAVDNLDLRVTKGEIFGFLGPNGAGKTTTIKMLLGLIYPTAGEATILGASIRNVKIREKVGYLPEQPYFYDYLTAEEFLLFYGGLFNISQSVLKLKIPELLELVGLKGRERIQLRRFSKGMLQRIGIAQAIINDPELVILDEPMSGLDPLGRKEVRDIILYLKESGKTIFFSSHVLPDVEMICDRIGIIGKGKLLKSGRVDELLHSMGTQSVEMTVEGLNGKSQTFSMNRNAQPRRVVQGGNRTLLIFENEADAQSQMQSILESGGKIVSIAPQKVSLEEYFMKQIDQKVSDEQN